MTEMKPGEQWCDSDFGDSDSGVKAHHVAACLASSLVFISIVVLSYMHMTQYA